MAIFGIGGGNKKNVSLRRFDEFMDWVVDQQQGNAGLSKLIDAVSFARRGITLRAQAISTLPWKIYRGDDIVQSSAEEKPTAWNDDAVKVWDLIEQALTVEGRAYLYNLPKSDKLRYWAPRTIEDVIDSRRGLVGFDRDLGDGNPPTFYGTDEVVYFYAADYRVEAGKPLWSPMMAAMENAGVLHYLTTMESNYFKNNTLFGLILRVSGNIKRDEKDTLKSWFKNIMRRGVDTQGEVGIFNADALEVQKLHDGLDEISNSDLSTEQREGIAVALGIPMSLYLSSSVSGLGGGGVATQDERHFYDKTIRPEAAFIQRVMNQQYFGLRGLRFVFDIDSLDVFQEDETQRANAFSTYIGGGMRPDVAAVMLGLEVPSLDEIPPEVTEAFMPPEPEEEPEPPRESEPEPEPEEEDDDNKAALDELGKWERFATRRIAEGKPEKAANFESDTIPQGVRSAVVRGLPACEDAPSVKALFSTAREWLADPLAAELRRANDLLEASLVQ